MAPYWRLSSLCIIIQNVPFWKFQFLFMLHTLLSLHDLYKEVSNNNVIEGEVVYTIMYLHNMFTAFAIHSLFFASYIQTI